MGIAANEWTDFLTEIKVAKEKLSGENNEPIWFRGQSNAEYNLIPSLLRYKNGLEKEKSLFDSFRKFTDRILQRRESEWETLFEMQHYGVPTRLLDWSETFAIALYFATYYHNSSKNDAAIYLLNPLKLNQSSKRPRVYVIPREENEYSYDRVYLNNIHSSPNAPVAIEPIFFNSRMLAQRGVFTVHDNNSNQPIENRFPDVIHRIVLRRELFPAALEFLNLSNINEYSVYPDLGGIANYLKTSSGLEKWETELSNDDTLILKKGMDCLTRNLSVIEAEMFISALMRSAYDYTQWRQEYFENAYKNGDGSQLENFLNAAADNDPHGISFGLEK